MNDRYWVKASDILLGTSQICRSYDLRDMVSRQPGSFDPRSEKPVAAGAQPDISVSDRAVVRRVDLRIPPASDASRDDGRRLGSDTVRERREKRALHRVQIVFEMRATNRHWPERPRPPVQSELAWPSCGRRIR